MRKIIIAGLLAVAALSATACGSTTSTNEQPETDAASLPSPIRLQSALQTAHPKSDDDFSGTNYYRFPMTWSCDSASSCVAITTLSDATKWRYAVSWDADRCFTAVLRQFTAHGSYQGKPTTQSYRSAGVPASVQACT